jgi:hypothetical protein
MRYQALLIMALFLCLQSSARGQERVRIADNESLERAYRDFAPLFPENLLLTPDGVKTLLDDLAPKNPKLAGADPKSFIDPSLVQEIEASGFLKQLYQR